MQEQSNKTANASPTKDLFISMLVKDIQLSRAIVDLIDNSIDGARRLRGDGDYNDLHIRIQISEDCFRIADNCGGISLYIAENYAFRFGRPADMESTTHSVGQFGVGMKRAIFKLGNKFRIESTSERDRFVIEENVIEWKDKPEWRFDFKELIENQPNPLDVQGTIIIVTSLHQTTADYFKLENYKKSLQEVIEYAHQASLNKGLRITLNLVPLDIRLSSLRQSEELQPAFKEIHFGEQEGQSVHVKIYAGISDSQPKTAGWNIFCNGRLVLGSDQTLTTGWGEDDEVTIPKYHNQFARFRGYVFFDSDNAGLLPWNTTKTGVDMDSPIYKRVRLEMIKTMRPIIDFLNRLKEEIEAKDVEEQEESTFLEKAIDNANTTSISEIQTISNVFIAPVQKPVIHTPRTSRILYYKPEDMVQKAKQMLGVRKNEDVGEKTFEYYMEAEGDD